MQLWFSAWGSVCDTEPLPSESVQINQQILVMTIASSETSLSSKHVELAGNCPKILSRYRVLWRRYEALQPLFSPNADEGRFFDFSARWNSAITLDRLAARR